MDSDIGNTDSVHLPVMPIWRTDAPPAPGRYRLLVDIDVFDNGKPSRIEREEIWDGERWSTLGGYARPVCWCAIIPPALDRNTHI